MKAVIVSGPMQPEDFVIREVEPPVLKDNQVLVNIRAAGLNPIDWSAPAFNYFDTLHVSLPYTAGNDLSGVVEKIGAGVRGFNVGDEVLGALRLQRQGSFATYAAIDEDLIVHKPPALPFTDAAAIPLSAETAWQALFEKLDIQKGQKVLIQAAAGGVGVFAVQLAKFAGAHVVAVGSERNTAFLKSLGADEVFDYHQGYATLSGDFDAVLDSVVSAAQTIPLLKRGGRYVSLTIPASQELADQYGVTISNFLYNSNAAQLKEVVRLIGEGALRVIVDKTFHFEDIVAALQYQRAGHSRGKNVLIMEKPL